MCIRDSTMSVLSEYPEEKVVIGIDGCGVPVFAYPMKNIATAYKNLACIDTIQDVYKRQPRGCARSRPS